MADFISEEKDQLLKLYEDAWCAHRHYESNSEDWQPARYIIWSSRNSRKKCLYSTYASEQYAWEKALERVNRIIIQTYEQ